MCVFVVCFRFEIPATVQRSANLCDFCVFSVEISATVLESPKKRVFVCCHSSLRCCSRVLQCVFVVCCQRSLRWYRSVPLSVCCVLSVVQEFRNFCVCCV